VDGCQRRKISERWRHEAREKRGIRVIVRS
jgi:hypothetical protein